MNLEMSMPELFANCVIIRATEVNDELVQACQHLIPQLTTNNPPPTRQQLSRLLASPASFLFIARDRDGKGEIVGLATLVIYYVPTGVRGYIEDMVVDERMRGRHIGKALTRACLEQAKLAGASQVMLTSNPGREAANRLYLRMGFGLRKTNVYRYSFK